MFEEPVHISNITSHIQFWNFSKLLQTFCKHFKKLYIEERRKQLANRIFKSLRHKSSHQLAQNMDSI